MAINFTKPDTAGPSVFVQVGVYVSRTKRTNTTFRVIHGVTLPVLKKGIQDKVNELVAEADSAKARD